MVVETQAEVLHRSLEDFYTPARFAELHEALSGERRVSLRVLDWLVTNYAKKRNIVYRTPDERDFNLFLEYKCELKGHSKKHFDMFCRRERIVFRGMRTTVGQLNFFRWAIRKGVLDYARAHHDAIEADMLASIQHRLHGPPGDATRRAELSKAAIKTCTATVLAVKVKF